jgi:hypothetical protein
VLAHPAPAHPAPLIPQNDKFTSVNSNGKKQKNNKV